MKLDMYKLLFSLIIAQTLSTTYGQTYSEMDTLLGHLFNESRYNKFLRPIRNQSQLLKVNLTQYLNSIEYFDITSGELLITGFFEITWNDELLTWNPSLYGGKEMISLPKGKFWKPEFSITNGPANDESSIYNNGFSPAWASYDGTVIMIPGGSYQTRCNVDTTLYPNDIHKCNFKFIVSNHDTADVMLYSPTSNIHMYDLQENGEWEINSTYAKVVLLKEKTIARVSIPMLQTSFSLKRRPMFELINIYGPLNLMSFLNAVTCFVRPDSGERLSFAVTLYLSFVFATTAAIDRIPNNSLQMPFLSYNLLLINFLYTVGVTWSILMVHIARKSTIQQRLPAFVVKMVTKKRQTQMSKSKLRPDGKSRVAFETVEFQDYSGESKDKGKQEQNAIYVPVTDITGQELANVLDTIYFWFILLFFLILNIFSGLMFNSKGIK